MFYGSCRHLVMTNHFIALLKIPEYAREVAALHLSTLRLEGVFPNDTSGGPNGLGPEGGVMGVVPLALLDEICSGPISEHGLRPDRRPSSSSWLW